MKTKEQPSRAGKVRDAIEFDAWITQAQANARVVYFHGTFAGHAPESLIALTQLAQERELVYLVQDHRNRDSAGHDYIAVRSSRPVQAVLKAAKHQPASLAEQARVEGERAFRSSGR